MSIKLSDKTILIDFSVGRWNGYKRDEKATKEVQDANGAARGTGNYNKKLLLKGAQTDLDGLIQEARNYHREQTLPGFIDGGPRILPALRYMTYTAQMNAYRNAFETKVEEFVSDFPEHVKSAKAKQGKLFNPADYPDPKKLRAHFSWDVTPMPFPDGEDFRVASLLGDGTIDTVREQLQEKVDAMWKDATRDIAERIIEVVKKMSERLKAYKPSGGKGKRAENTFKDTLVENVRELVELLPSFNLNNDPKFEAIIEKAKKELCHFDADDLREDGRTRKKVAASADAVLKAVSEFIA